MKLVLTGLLSIGLLFSLTACGGGDSSDAGDSVGETLTALDANTDQTEDKVALSNPGPFSVGDFGDINLSNNYDSVKNSLSNAVLIDIRTEKEREFYGYPEGFVSNVPYQNRDYYEKEDGNLAYHTKPLNPTFVEDVKTAVNDDLNKKVILICDSSSRSGAHTDKTKDSAAKLLSEKGFTNVYHIFGGFRGNAVGSYQNGWLDYHLPLGK